MMLFRNHIFVALMGAGSGWVAQGQPLQLIQVAEIPTVPYLGVGTQDVSAEMTKALKLPEEAGVEVTKLIAGSPAALAGIKEGDVVMRYNGQRVEGNEQFVRLLRETIPGRDVKLQIFRNGAPQFVTAKLILLPAEWREGQLVAMQPHPTRTFQTSYQDVPRNRTSSVSSSLGAELESLEGQLANYFGVKDGVLVRSVTHGSAGDKAGLKAGDVITHVADALVTTPADVSLRMRAGRGQSAMLTVQREHREITLAVALDGNRPGEQ